MRIKSTLNGRTKKKEEKKNMVGEFSSSMMMMIINQSIGHRRVTNAL
jgi:hypothetical protein